MRIEAVELRRAGLPLVRPFRTSYGVETFKDVLVIRVLGADGEEGWGECVAMAEPTYSAEFVDGAAVVLRDHLVPRLFGIDLSPTEVTDRLAAVRGHPMAKACIEMAVLDAVLRAEGRSFADALGGVRDAVDCGVSVGIADSIPALLGEIDGYLAAGYRRIKLKIETGWDVEPVQAVRERFGDVMLQVDANAAYSVDDWPHLALLDPFELVLIEQPLAEHDIAGHAELAQRIATPICLDESITSAAAAADAIARGACGVVNIKAGRVGGFLEAVRVHDVCRAAGIPVWCGGMLETGLGRAGNVALAALPGFTLPGDTSASDRYFVDDLTEPFVLVDGQLRVPTGPGLGVAPRPDRLQACTTSVELLR